jgi:hypothetical protein
MERSAIRGLTPQHQPLAFRRQRQQPLRAFVRWSTGLLRKAGLFLHGLGPLEQRVRLGPGLLKSPGQFDVSSAQE